MGGSPAEPVAVPDGGPRILLCAAGSADVATPGGHLEVKRGGALWLGADDTGLTLTPGPERTQLFLAGDALGA